MHILYISYKSQNGESCPFLRERTRLALSYYKASGYPPCSLFTPSGMSLSSTLYPASLPLDTLYGLDVPLGFDTIDGYRISQQEGEAALRSGVVVLVGGLLVGFVACIE